MFEVLYLSSYRQSQCVSASVALCSKFEFYDCKNDNFPLKNCNSFLIFALKHRVWVLIRTPH